MDQDWRITGGTALLDGALRPAELALAGGRIATAAPGGRVLDARGLRFFFASRNYFDFKDLMKIYYPYNDKEDYARMEAASRRAGPAEVDLVTDVKDSDIDDMFSIWDGDGSGELNKEEFRDMLRKLGVTDEEEVDRYFGEIDADGGGSISIAELKEWWLGFGFGGGDG